MDDVDLHSRHLNVISLCTGGGGLDRALELAIPSARPVVCVEREGFACANLVAQMQAGVMAPAALWGDARSFRGRPWRGLVDGVIGGIPCQPWSVAGKQRGRLDERDLWSTARRIFVQSGAWFILIENVGGMLSGGGAERVRRDLHRLGCTVEGGLFTAEEVGAPQKRERLFILGVADRDCGNGDRRGIIGPGRWRQPPDGGFEVANGDGTRWPTSGCGSALDDGREPKSRRVEMDDAACCGGRLHQGWRRSVERALDAGGRSEELAHAGHAGPQGRGPSGDQPGQCATAERGGGPLADAPDIGPSGIGRRRKARTSERRDELVNAPRIGRGEGRPEPELRSGRHTFASDGESMDYAVRGRYEHADQAVCPRRNAAVHAGIKPMGDAIGRGHDGRPEGEVEEPQRRVAVEWASHGPLFAPGPGDVEAWRFIAERYPERLPAISRHDLFRIDVGKALAAFDGDPAPRQGLDPKSARALRAAVIQAVAESTLRRRSDGLASRTDELRMLGNGVVDLAGAYAIRTLATRLAARGSAGATLLVRMMT